MCGNGQIAVSIQTSYVGTGSAAEVLGFLNVGRSACTLYGYPGVAGLNSRSQQIAQAGRSTDFGSSPASVNVDPGHLAEALVQGSDGAVRTCGYFTRSFLVTPPNLTRSVRVTATSTSAALGVSAGCEIAVGPVTPETAQPIPSG